MRSNQTATSSVNARQGAILSIAFGINKFDNEFKKMAESKAAFFERAGADLLSTREDFLQACALAALEFPARNSSQIVAIVTNKGKQARAKSAIARVRLDAENDDDSAIEIEAPETSSIDDYRLLAANEEGEIDTIRLRIQSENNLTDRAVRYRLTRAAERAERADTDDFFGRESYAAALKKGAAK